MKKIEMVANEDLAKKLGGVCIVKYTSHRGREKLANLYDCRFLKSIDFALYVNHNAATGFALVTSPCNVLPNGCAIPKKVYADLDTTSFWG